MTKHDRCFLSPFVPFSKSIIKKTQNTKVFILYFKAHTISCSGVLLREKLEIRGGILKQVNLLYSLLLLCGQAEHLPFHSFKLNSEKEKAHKKA